MTSSPNVSIVDIPSIYEKYGLRLINTDDGIYYTHSTKNYLSVALSNMPVEATMGATVSFLNSFPEKKVELVKSIEPVKPLDLLQASNPALEGIECMRWLLINKLCDREEMYKYLDTLGVIADEAINQYCPKCSETMSCECNCERCKNMLCDDAYDGISCNIIFCCKKCNPSYGYKNELYDKTEFDPIYKPVQNLVQKLFLCKHNYDYSLRLFCYAYRKRLIVAQYRLMQTMRSKNFL